ncbi:MAG TPA: diguanylate cyclase, partial [Turneriella sp.]|nr:diguanylate cyclase [Turneriella sp.]
MRSLLQRKMLLASVIFIAVLPILASASFITYRSFQQAKLDAVDRAKTLLSHVTERQKQLIVQTLQSLRILTQLPDILAGKRECSLFLRKFIERNPYYVNAGLVDAKGNIICSAQEPKHKINVSQREWFNMAMKTQVGQIGGLQFGLITGKPSIVAALPIVEENLVTHVLYLSISVSWLEDVFAEYSLPEKSQITALDSHGLVLFQHPQKVENEPSLLGKEFPSQKVWNHIKGSGENIVPARIYEDGGRYVYTFQRIEAEDRVAMVIALRFIESEIYRQATRDGIALVLGLLLSLLSTLIIAYVAGNYLFLKPVAEEIDKLHDVAETDELTQVLNRRGFVRLFKEKLEEEASNDYHALLLIDLDHFKNVNDTYGHSAGDAVLKET